MKKILRLLAPGLFLLPVCAPAQMPDSLKACLDSAINTAQQISLYRHTINWDEVSMQLHWQASLAQNPMDLRPVFQQLLETLRDGHGRFFLQNRPIAWYHGDPAPYQQHIDPKFWAVVQSGKYPFQYAMLPGNTGYLRIPGMSTGDNTQLAAPIQSAICSLQELGARQWIIDLRYNGGGNMFPMLGGLAGLLGNGEIGGSMDAIDNRFSTWSIKNGDVYYNDAIQADIIEQCPADPAAKVAVLTSRYTVSSGEVVAIAFKGRPNTRFFGEHTAGFTTETNWVSLPAGVTMSISVSYFADRQGLVYKEYVPVDEEAPFTPDAPLEEDVAVHRALEWLSSR